MNMELHLNFLYCDYYYHDDAYDDADVDAYDDADVDAYDDADVEVDVGVDVLLHKFTTQSTG